ncbi:hypothetical protein NIES2101_07495 [Calothrix sp. HK-06]|nr:hypothetical protein NIES2101_07495 [Calothrix sp. HK-06]
MHLYSNHDSGQQLENLISNLLKYGVIVACSTVLVGGVIYLAQYGLEPVDYRFFEGQPSVLDAPNLMISGVLAGSYSSIIILGLLLLIAIPVIRVVLSLLTFVKQRDLTYMGMTLLALSGLIYSFVSAC